MPRCRQPVTSNQQPEPVIQAVQQLCQAERLNPRRGQLNRQRHPIQPLHQPGHQRPGPAAHGEMRIHLAGPVSEQRHRLRPTRLRLPRPRQPQRRQPVPRLPRHPGRLPAGRQDPHIIGGQQHSPAQSRHGRDHMLAVIQHQQHLPASQHPGQRISHRHPRPLVYPQRRRHRRRHPRRIRDRRQLNQPHPVGEPVSHPPGYLTGQPGLTHPARPGHRHQPVVIQHASDLTDRTRPADETRQRRRKPMHPRYRSDRSNPHENYLTHR